MTEGSKEWVLLGDCRVAPLLATTQTSTLLLFKTSHPAPPPAYPPATPILLFNFHIPRSKSRASGFFIFSLHLAAKHSKIREI